ncbi:hypothetical protein ACYCCF_16545 [Streptomyces argenteolus]
MPPFRSRRSPLPVIAAALLLPLAACSSSGDEASGGSGRLRAVMAFPPAQAMTPYGDDAISLSRLAVIEGLTTLDPNGIPEPALAASWKRDNASLGTQAPAPEWGRMLSENMPYAERAPWAVLAPAAALAVLGALAVLTSAAVRGGRRR